MRVLARRPASRNATPAPRRRRRRRTSMTTRARRRGLLAQRLVSAIAVGRDVADRDVAALGRQLAGELAAHAGAAAGDDGELPCELVHPRSPSSPPPMRAAGRQSLRRASRRARQPPRRRTVPACTPIRSPGPSPCSAAAAPWPAEDGEPVFAEPWEGRAFAMALDVVDRAGPAVGGLPQPAHRRHRGGPARGRTTSRGSSPSSGWCSSTAAVDARRPRPCPQPGRRLPLRRGRASATSRCSRSDRRADRC